MQLEQAEPGYFNGDMQVGVGCGASPDVGFHVEAVEAKLRSGSTVAVNDAYQSIIDNWLIRNDGCSPKLLTVGKKQYFINIEVFAK